MSIRFDSQCIECHLRHSLETARKLGTEEQATLFARELLKLYLSAPDNAASPWFGPATNALFTKFYGLDADRFKQEKLDSNRFVLERMDLFRERVANSGDSLYTGLKYAILGNYIDFSALQGEVSFDTLDEILSKAEKMELDGETFSQFRRELETGKKLLYITDNAGEIGFDRIFAEQIHTLYPHLQITFCVRGAPIINDATREDAEFIGIPFPVIENGCNIAGTPVDLISPEAKQALEDADVILAKGMGNTETLYGCGHHIFYAFLVKCPRFIQFFQKPFMTTMFIREGQSFGQSH